MNFSNQLLGTKSFTYCSQHTTTQHLQDQVLIQLEKSELISPPDHSQPNIQDIQEPVYQLQTFAGTRPTSFSFSKGRSPFADATPMQNSTIPWPDTFPQSPDRSSLPICSNLSDSLHLTSFLRRPRKIAIKSRLTSTIVIRQISKVNECRPNSRHRGRANKKTPIASVKGFFLRSLHADPFLWPLQNLQTPRGRGRHPLFRRFYGNWIRAFVSLSNLTLILITHKKKRAVDRVSCFSSSYIVTIPVHRVKKKKSFK